jgi:2-desacetyl-2-hydroxyethyl bacteriochlorophyllide A dehydrogenase
MSKESEHSMRGHAVVFEDRLKVVYREVEIPEPSEDDVVVDVQFSWISTGTESSFLKGQRIQGEITRKDDDPWPFPSVMGYQKTGVIRQVGSRVAHLKPGDRVFVATSKISNMFFPVGGHVSPAVAEAQRVWKLPVHAADADYSGMVLTQVGYNCGTRAPADSSSRAVVIGDGLVGNWAAQTLKHRGAEVLVLGRHDERLNYLPVGIGAVNVNTASITDRIQADWSGKVNIVVDSVGDMNTVERLWPFMVRDSHLVSAGFLGTSGMIDIQRMRLKEMTLHTPSGWGRLRMNRTLEGIHEGWLQTGSLITHRFPVEQAAEAWRTILDNKFTTMGVILEWQERNGSS